MVHKLIKSTLFVAFLVLTLCYGVIAGVKELFPFQEIYTLYQIFSPALNTYTGMETNYKSLPKLKEIVKFDVKDIIDINSYEDAIRKRNDIIKYIWRNGNISGHDKVSIHTKNIKNPLETKASNLDNVALFEAHLPKGFSSKYYRFTPKKETGCLFIFHQGHSANINSRGGEKLINKFIEQGCVVLGFLMPMDGINKETKVVFDNDFGPIEINGHVALGILDTNDFSPIRIFIEPVLMAISYEDYHNNYSKIGMSGISGGGWTTTIVSAIEPRINKSYPVAGSLPLYLRPASASWGDWEQHYPAFYRVANYLELYILGSLEKSRTQLQILNTYDPCCFSGRHYTLYESDISDLLLKMNAGKFKIFSDSSHYEHTISSEVINMIYNDFLEN